VLALIIGILLLVVGETTAEVDLTLEFERIDSLFWLIGLPTVSLLLFLILSPVSYLIHRKF
jgi:uncharacterized BrkB/YihY/UPF0761 family membrane protein